MIELLKIFEIKELQLPRSLPKGAVKLLIDSWSKRSPVRSKVQIGVEFGFDCKACVNINKLSSGSVIKCQYKGVKVFLLVSDGKVFLKSNFRIVTGKIDKTSVIKIGKIDWRGKCESELTICNILAIR